MRRRGAPREARHGQVEPAPEEMHGAHLAHEPGAEPVEDAVGLRECEIEAMDGVGVVTGVVVILVEREDVPFDLYRRGPDRRGQSEVVELAHDLRVEIGNRPGLERDRAPFPVCCRDVEAVVQEVEVDLEAAPALVGDRRCRQPGGAHIKRHVPPVVDDRRVGHADLADDLRPQVQGVSCRRPVVNRQRRPDCAVLCGSRRGHRSPTATVLRAGLWCIPATGKLIPSRCLVRLPTIPHYVVSERKVYLRWCAIPPMHSSQANPDRRRPSGMHW